MKLNKKSDFFCTKCGERLILVADDSKPFFNTLSGEKTYYVTEICPVLYTSPLSTFFKNSFLGIIGKIAHSFSHRQDTITEYELKKDIGY